MKITTMWWITFEQEFVLHCWRVFWLHFEGSGEGGRGQHGQSPLCPSTWFQMLCIMNPLNSVDAHIPTWCGDQILWSFLYFTQILYFYTDFIFLHRFYLLLSHVFIKILSFCCWASRNIEKRCGMDGGCHCNIANVGLKKIQYTTIFCLSSNSI